MSTYDLLAAHAAALEAAGSEDADVVYSLSETLGTYQAARAHLAIVRTPAWGASVQEISGARRRVRNRWDDVLLALTTYDVVTEELLADTSIPGAVDDVLLDVPSVMAAVQMEAPRPDEVGRNYDPDYPVPFLDAPDEPKPEPKPAGFATLSQQDLVAAAMAQIHDLPARVSAWPDPAGLFDGVKPAPAGDHLIVMDDRTVIVNDAGDVICDCSVEVPF